MPGPADTNAGDPLLPLLVRGSWLAVPAAAALEVLQLEGVHSFPLAPPWIVGLVALRGRALPLLDLGVFLDLPGQPGADRLVVASALGMTIGIPAARVRGVTRPEAGAWAPPDVVTGQLARFATGTVRDGDRLLVVLDLAAILDAARVRGESA